jgi:hypothetical protein
MFLLMVDFVIYVKTFFNYFILKCKKKYPSLLPNECPTTHHGHIVESGAAQPIRRPEHLTSTHIGPHLPQ